MTNEVHGLAPVRVLLLSGGMDSGVMACRYFHQDTGPTKVKTHALSFYQETAHGAMECRMAGIIAEKYCDSHEVVGIPFMEHVKFRHGIMLSIAVGYAESIGASVVVSGSGGDGVNPDSQREFMEAFKQAAIAGTSNQVRVYAPFAPFSKRDIALEGKKLGFNFSETWSCKESGDKHCGVCGSCIKRRAALAGFDPTAYAAIVKVTGD